MLIRFEVANFRSFRDAQEVSLLAGNYHVLPNNVVQACSYNLLKSVAVYGANASGKSNLIAAIAAVRSIVVDSATGWNQGQPLPGIAPFRLSSDCESEPSRFVVEFCDPNGLHYVYELSATKNRIHEECLFGGLPNSDLDLLFRRTVHDEPHAAEWEFGEALKGFENPLKAHTRPNASAISTAAMLNLRPTHFVYWWFNHLWVFNLSKPPTDLMTMTAKWAGDDAIRKGRVQRLLKDADLGIESISIQRVELERNQVTDRFENALFAALTSEVATSIRDRLLKSYDIRTYHRNDKGEPEEFYFTDESNGTQRLFAISGPLLDAIEKGAVLVIDELECSMHSHLSEKLLELIHSSAINPSGAQLVFASHDSTLMDNTLMRPDQLYIAQKGNDGASRITSLSEFDDVRSVHTYGKRYRAGRYGGVPQFGPLLQDPEHEWFTEESTDDHSDHTPTEQLAAESS